MAFNNKKIYDVFINEYMLSLPSQSWEVFINTKQLGIQAVSCNGLVLVDTEYIIVDAKKWMYNKLKYGF